MVQSKKQEDRKKSEVTVIRSLKTTVCNQANAWPCRRFL